ncbi:hypothetical protein MHLP_03770 [Candidatus Mycoplasma haematolamae str. Purdue]|uniref:Uncharacterized protein n=1 Tax=Mycoplasma haematolamae (strain Purdue) TaxID=1212765 RepID=I7CKB0_MYCHA|nr:hypothetical protein MHLP_03770 [Candidatus Mycoplasma haematolamae str. Purdue]
MVTRGTSYSWASITFLGSLVPKARETYADVKSCVSPIWTFLTSYWQTLWEFLLSSFTSIDLMKIHDLLTTEQKRKAISKVLGADGQSQFEQALKSMKSVVSKAKGMKVNYSGPFKKLMKSLLEAPEKASEELTKLNKRLPILDGFLISSNSQKAQSFMNFFSGQEESIQKLNY